jgi:RimJ/RimL family protein N-acetyltransferase
MEIVFETPRLLLRQFTLKDVTILLELNSDPVVLKYLHEPLLQDEAHAETILKTIILPQYERKLGRWAVHLKDDNSFLGWCGLKYRPELEEIDLGYRFMQTAWGKGFATEAAQETLEYGFKKLNLSLITGRAHIENLASIRVLEKIGMEYIGEGIIDDCPVKTFIMKNPY